MTTKLIEVEPGAPLPPEAPPWAERCELVQKPGLSDEARRAVQGTGVALMGVAAAATWLLGSAGSVGLYAALAAILGLVVLFAGLIGVPPSEKYVPSPNGRYVAVYEPDPPLDPAGQGEARGSEGRIRWFETAGIVVVVAIFSFLYASGFLPLESAGAIVLAYLLPPAVNAVKRRLKSEAEVSERFLQASDPRNPIPFTASGSATPQAALSAPETQGRGEVPDA